MPWTTRTRHDVFQLSLMGLKDRVDRETSFPTSPFPENWKSKHAPVLERVLALGINPDLDEVDQILDPEGSNTHPRCTECGQLRDLVLRFSDDERSPDICLQCLKEAIEQLSNPTAAVPRSDEHGSIGPPPRPWCWEEEGGNHHWHGETCRWCPTKSEGSQISS